MDRIEIFIGQDKLTVSEAMQKIDANSSGILFLVDDGNKLLGCLTDGDVRRFLLSGGSMSAKALEAANKSPKIAKSEYEAERLYHNRDFVIIPIIDENGILLDLYAGKGKGMKDKAPLKMPVIINAGGRGTRLDPFTKVLPKPLIPVGEIPIIEHIIREYQSYECNDFHVIVNYKKELMKAYFSDCESNYSIKWYDEEKPLGTGGGLSLLRGAINETFFFANCDALLTANYESMVKFHKENKNAITMICAYKNINIPYGVVDIGLNGVIEKMREKPLISFLTNTGVYIVEPEVINDIEEGVPIGFPDIVEMERQKGKKVSAFPISENEWMDMGQLSELNKMRIKMYGE